MATVGVGRAGQPGMLRSGVPMDVDPWLLPLSMLTVIAALALAALGNVWWPLLVVVLGGVSLWWKSSR